MLVAGEKIIAKNRRKFEEAISSYKTTIKLKPYFAEAQHNLKTVLLWSEEKDGFETPEPLGSKFFDNGATQP